MAWGAVRGGDQYLVPGQIDSEAEAPSPPDSVSI